MALRLSIRQPGPAHGEGEPCELLLELMESELPSCSVAGARVSSAWHCLAGLPVRVPASP